MKKAKTAPIVTTGAEAVRWDLSTLYAGVHDPKLESDIVELEARMKRFGGNYRGRLASKLGKAIGDFSAIEMLSAKISLYLFLMQSANVNDDAVKSAIAEAERRASEASGRYLTFFDLELTALPDVVLNRLYRSDPLVQRHRPWIEHIRVFKKHLLSEPVEASLTKRSPFGPGAWSELFDEFEADLRFDYDGGKKTLPEMLHILSTSKSAKERAEVLVLINSGFEGPFAKYAAQTLHVVAGLRAVDGQERSYRHPMEFRNKSNRIPDRVVEMLHEVVRDVGGPLAQRYYRLKAAHLGLKKLAWSDRNAPLPFSDEEKIPYSEAWDMVLAAYESFSPTLAGIIRDTAAAKRVDAPADAGKRGGAFNYSVVLPGNVPVSFTFLNYLGSRRDVKTLAHELGHGVHGILAGQAQGTLMSHTPIAYCETASVFGEAVTFNFMKRDLQKKGDDKAMLALLFGKIDDLVNTVVRQIGFSNFERRLHGYDETYKKSGSPKKFSVSELDTLWLETAQELYGKDGDVFTYNNSEHFWAYISHFHRPFYVYGYAFGELLTHSLYAQQKRLGDKFEPLYLDLLRSGGTKDVVALLKPFGLDPTKRDFWANGLAVSLQALIEEAEVISRRIGVKV